MKIVQQTEEATKLWQKLDSHGKTISELESLRRLDDHRLTTVERRQDDTCKQLVATETTLMREIKETNVKLSALIADGFRKEGAEAAGRKFYFVIAVILAVGQVVNMLKAFGGE